MSREWHGGFPQLEQPLRQSIREGWRYVLSLSRLVIEPDVPKNAASFLLAGAEKWLRLSRWRWLLTYADTLHGHTGAIYRAANWEYVGLTKPEAVYLDDAGRMVARKAGPHTRTRTEMEALGYRRVISPGKHKFIKRLPASNRSNASMTLFEEVA